MYWTTIRRIAPALLLTFCFYAPAAAEGDTLKLSMQELFEIGTEQNLRLAADRIKEMMADEQSSAARMAAYPDMDLSLSGGYVGQPVVFRNGLANPEYPDTPDWQQSYSISLSQPVYHGGKIRLAVEKADIEKEMASLETAADRADIKLALLEQYLTLFNLYRQEYVLERNITESERRLKDIVRMKEEGLITNNDVLRSELQLTEHRLAAQETRNNIRIASRQLDILLGLDEDLVLMPDTTLLDSDYDTLEYEDYISMAYDYDPSFKILKKKTELAMNGVKLMKSEMIPSLSFIASDALARPISRTLADQFSNSWNIGLSIRVPISSTYKYRDRVRAARLEAELRLNEEEQMMQQMRMDIKTALLKHGEAVSRVQALALSVRQAEENYRIMRNRYMNQLAILTDLLDADNLRLNAELQLTAAKTRVIYTYYQLQRMAGRL